MLEDIELLARNYIDNDELDCEQLGLIGTPLSPSDWGQQNPNYIEGLYRGKHFAMLLNILLYDGKLYDLSKVPICSRYSIEPDYVKFILYIVKYMDYRECISILKTGLITKEIKRAIIKRLAYLVEIS